MTTPTLKNTTKKKINKLELELWNKEYYIRSIISFLRDISHNPWDKAIYSGFERMCNEE